MNMTTISGCTESQTLLASAASASEVKVADFFKRLFALWISGLAAITFMGALFLAIVSVISWSSLGYVYVSITVVTLLLAALSYVSQVREES
jgi:hypothetical protein